MPEYDGRDLKARMQTLHDEWGASWSDIATLWGLSKTTAWRFATTDYVPRRFDIRQKLGLPEPIVSYRWRTPNGRFASNPD
ncbi:MAG: hypothetical protein GTO22_12125 [Gemmatimonadales bacterium]|nr:hypothetical protein [Gemmatimonadales bacterium]